MVGGFVFVKRVFEVFLFIYFGFGGFSLFGVLEGLGVGFFGGGKLVWQWRKLDAGIISVLMLFHTELGI